MDNSSKSGWTIASDGIQWILQRRHNGQQRSVSFVHSSRDVLARCMSENGVHPQTASELLKGLPPTFNEWSRMTVPRASRYAQGAASVERERWA
jgi:hypothetical protein